MRSSLLLVAALLLACGGAAEPPEPQGDGGDTPAVVPPLARHLAPDEVRAGVITDPSELIGGPKADGRVGDVKLYNQHVAFLIEGVRRTSGYRAWGGTPVDIDLVRPEGEPGRDLFSEVIPTWNLAILHPEVVEVVSDGADGLAHVRVTGHSGPFDWATHNKFVFFDLVPTSLAITYDYRLAPDDRVLELEVTVTNLADEVLELETPYLLSIHGDGVFPWAPGSGYDASYGAPLPYVGVAGRDLSYAVVSSADDLAMFIDYASISILTQEPWTLDAGASATRTYWFVVTEGGASGLDAARRALLEPESPVGAVSGAVILPETTTAEDAWVAAWQETDVVTMGPVAADGTFALELAPGEYELRAYAHDHAASEAVAVALAVGDEAEVVLSVPAAARVALTIDDGAGAPAAARVTFLRTSEPDTAPPTTVLPAGRLDWEPGVAALACVVDGAGDLLLPGDATYEVTASRGFTAGLDTTSLSVAAGEVASLALSVPELVDTAGFVAADLHLHAGGSWDSHIPPEARAREAVCEGLALPVLTDHSMAGGLGEVAAAAGVDDRIAGLPGQEVTSFIYGHFNAFPLAVDPEAPNRGAVYPLDKTPLEVFAAMRSQGGGGDRIIQVNHPRDALLGGYFEHVGFDPATGDVALPDEWTLDFDAIEVFNKSCSGPRNLATRADWVALTNLGHRKALSSGSDSHSEGVPLGMPRNFVQLELDAALSDTAAVIEAVRGRRMVVSCGPFVRFEASDGTPLGGLAGAASFEVEVQAPPWMAVDEVRLLEDGVVIETVAVEGGDDPIVRFSGQLTAAPAADAWYAVEVEGSGDLAPVSWYGHPYALTNPIEVDVDGDGQWAPPGL